MNELIDMIVCGEIDDIIIINKCKSLIKQNLFRPNDIYSKCDCSGNILFFVCEYNKSFILMNYFLSLGCDMFQMSSIECSIHTYHYTSISTAIRTTKDKSIIDIFLCFANEVNTKEKIINEMIPFLFYYHVSDITEFLKTIDLYKKYKVHPSSISNKENYIFNILCEHNYPFFLCGIEFIEYLVDHSTYEINFFLMKYLLYTVPNIFNKIITLGTNINKIKNDNDCSLLHDCCHLLFCRGYDYKYKSSLNVLIEQYHIDMYMKNKYNQTPFHMILSYLDYDQKENNYSCTYEEQINKIEKMKKGTIELYNYFIDHDYELSEEENILISTLW